MNKLKLNDTCEACPFTGPSRNRQSNNLFCCNAPVEFEYRYEDIPGLLLPSPDWCPLPILVYRESNDVTIYPLEQDLDIHSAHCEVLITDDVVDQCTDRKEVLKRFYAFREKLISDSQK